MGSEVNALPELYAKDGIRINKDTIYLNHMLTCVSHGIFDGLRAASDARIPERQLKKPIILLLRDDLCNSLISLSCLKERRNFTATSKSQTKEREEPSPLFPQGQRGQAPERFPDNIVRVNVSP